MRLLFSTFRLLFFLTVLTLLLSSCIVPPQDEHARVINDKEIRVISLINLAKGYTARGRMESAEDYYRDALAIRQDMPSVYNDLGYVLQVQLRAEEAAQMYRRAIELAPRNVVAYENLARLLYQQGKYRESLEQYDKIIDLLNETKYEQLTEITGVQIGPGEFSRIYREQAVVYYAMGDLNEAMCYSARTIQNSGSIVDAGQYGRLLLSLEKSGLAVDVFRSVLAVNPVVPPKILLDYGIALYAAGDKSMAKTSLMRLLTMSTVSRSDRRTAHLLRLQIAMSEQNKKEMRIMFDTLTEEDPELCEEKVVDNEDYWPFVVIDDVKNLRQRLCSNENEPFLED